MRYCEWRRKVLVSADIVGTNMLDSDVRHSYTKVCSAFLAGTAL